MLLALVGTLDGWCGTDVSLSLISEQLFKSPRWNQIRVERWTMIDSLNDERSEWRHNDSAIWSELSRAPNQFRILLSSLQAVNDAWWWLLWLHLALGHRVTWAQWGCATLGFYRTALVYPPVLMYPPRYPSDFEQVLYSRPPYHGIVRTILNVLTNWSKYLNSLSKSSILSVMKFKLTIHAI